ncbi:MAG: DUF3616 domain-containing protein [Phycisphaerae bacterium]|nr:DUF3616 domain-containing protein [Phycisphaerae bacterium]
MGNHTALKTCLAVLPLLMGCGAGADKAPDETVLVFNGMSDASAGVFLTADRFVVADDESNSLRIYAMDQPSTPCAAYDISGFLRTTVLNPEADIEGAARAGDRIYWITSHGRNKDGKERPNRYRFFATDIRRDGSDIGLVPAGRPCNDLVPALLQAPFARALGLHEAVRLGENLKKKDREKLAPKDEGLNIEALAATADGKVLYIGFRNPRPAHPVTGRRQALVVPMTNGKEVIDLGRRPQFGQPILWDMGGLGLRSMDYCPAHKAFFLTAGSHDEGNECVLYRWSGDPDETPMAIQRLKDFAPEALMPAPDGKRLLLLSDDGSRPVRISHPSECLPGELIDDRTCQNKHLADPAKKTFRAVYVVP